MGKSVETPAVQIRRIHKTILFETENIDSIWTFILILQQLVGIINFWGMKG